MKIACLCPTYGRPALLANSIALFNMQSHPAEERKLFILDDAGQYDRIDSPTVQLISFKERAEKITDKYHALTAMAKEWKPDAVAIWDDDDLYLPGHLAAAAKVFESDQWIWDEDGKEWRYFNNWAKPSRIFSTYGRMLNVESTAGRFWATASFRWEAWLKIGMAGDTHRADFDQLVLGAATKQLGRECDTLSPGDLPTFVFRWEDTGAAHSQGAIRTADDCEWYDRMRRDDLPFVGQVVPQLDDAAIKTMRQIDRIRGAGCEVVRQEY